MNAGVNSSFLDHVSISSHSVYRKEKLADSADCLDISDSPVVTCHFPYCSYEHVSSLLMSSLNMCS